MSQKLTFEQLRRGAQQDLAECLKMENRMVDWAIGLEYMNVIGLGCMSNHVGTWRATCASSISHRAAAAATALCHAQAALLIAGPLPGVCRAVAFSQVASAPPLPTPTVQVTRCVTNAGSDFYSGVTAALITRSGNPAWVPASLKDVRLCWRIGLLHNAGVLTGVPTGGQPAALAPKHGRKQAARAADSTSRCTQPHTLFCRAQLRTLHLLYLHRCGPNMWPSSSSRCRRSRSCSCRPRRPIIATVPAAAAAAAARVGGSTRGCKLHSLASGIK